jgi:hypothetical protein
MAWEIFFFKLAFFLANLGCVLVLITVHEYGHLLAGWWGGIPLRDMKVRLLTFPQHVVFRDGPVWVGPFELDRYVTIMFERLTTLPTRFFYVAGGFLLETIFSWTAVFVAWQMGWLNLARMIAMHSLILYVIYLFLMDLPMALWRRTAWGDTSGLWFLSRLGTVVLTCVLLFTRIGLLWYIYS